MQTCTMKIRVPEYWTYLYCYFLCRICLVVYHQRPTSVQAFASALVPAYVSLSTHRQDLHCHAWGLFVLSLIFLGIEVCPHQDSFCSFYAKLSFYSSNGAHILIDSIPVEAKLQVERKQHHQKAMTLVSTLSLVSPPSTPSNCGLQWGAASGLPSFSAYLSKN